MTFITIGLIVFVAALNILISLTMMVMEKTRDIAVLMSMGTRKCAGAAPVYYAGTVDWRDRHRDWTGARLRALLGGRPLSPVVAGA